MDHTVFKKVLVLETLKTNPKLALKLLFKRPSFYLYGALYKFFGTDGLRKRFFEAMKEIPVADFDVKHIDPEYLKIPRLAQWKDHKVIFLTSNPPNLAKKWEERIRNMFPNLDFEVRSVPTIEEKIRFANKLAKVVGEKNVYFFDDSLPLSGRLGDRFDGMRMKVDKAALLYEYEKMAKIRDKIMKRYFEEAKRLASQHGAPSDLGIAIDRKTSENMKEHFHGPFFGGKRPKK